MKKRIEHNKEVLRNLKNISKRLKLDTEEKIWIEGQIECVESLVRRLEYQQKKVSELRDLNFN